MRDCERVYHQAFNFAQRKFNPIQHLRLGLILNNAIFVKRHIKDTDKAIKIL